MRDVFASRGFNETLLRIGELKTRLLKYLEAETIPDRSVKDVLPRRIAISRARFISRVSIWGRNLSLMCGTGVENGGYGWGEGLMWRRVGGFFIVWGRFQTVKGVGV